MLLSSMLLGLGVISLNALAAPMANIHKCTAVTIPSSSNVVSCQFGDSGTTNISVRVYSSSVISAPGTHWHCSMLNAYTNKNVNDFDHSVFSKVVTQNNQNFDIYLNKPTGKIQPHVDPNSLFEIYAYVQGRHGQSKTVSLTCTKS